MAKKPPVSALLDLSGQTALVTGASGGIGAGIAARLAEAGASVAVHFRGDDVGAAKTLAAIEGVGGTARLFKADLGEEATVSRLIDGVTGDLGLPTIAVNNAGVQPVVPLAQMTFEQWQSVTQTNLNSTYLVTQAVARRLAAAKEPGAIVNVASIEAFDPASGHAHYTSSKAGIAMFTRAAALEYGKDSIRINSVSPGLIDRDGLAQAWPDGVARWKDAAPLMRLGTPDDVADAVLYLVSPAARWVTGANILVDGGMSAKGRW